MAVDIFLKFSNNIKGESQDSTFKDDSDVLAWNWGLTQSGTTHLGKGGGGGKVMTMVPPLKFFILFFKANISAFGM